MMARPDDAKAPRSRVVPLVALGFVLVAGAGYAAVRMAGASEDEGAARASAGLDQAAPDELGAQAVPVGDRHGDPRRRDLAAADRPSKGGFEVEVRQPSTGSNERPKTPTKEDLQAALRAVRITVYTTTWCPHCTRARAWLRANDFAYTERDVEASESAKRDRDRINPRKGVPTADIDGEVLVGFGEQSWSAAIARATQHRLDARKR